jgi:hypothetical protein
MDISKTQDSERREANAELAERLFGRPSTTHTHPATHPLWLTFTTGNCVVCGNASTS